MPFPLFPRFSHYKYALMGAWWNELTLSHYWPLLSSYSSRHTSSASCTYTDYRAISCPHMHSSVVSLSYPTGSQTWSFHWAPSPPVFPLPWSSSLPAFHSWSLPHSLLCGYSHHAVMILWKVWMTIKPSTSPTTSFQFTPFLSASLLINSYVLCIPPLVWVSLVFSTFPMPFAVTKTLTLRHFIFQFPSAQTGHTLWTGSAVCPKPPWSSSHSWLWFLFIPSGFPVWSFSWPYQSFYPSSPFLSHSLLL